jgi:REP element-mobilizing transposase RayT
VNAVANDNPIAFFLTWSTYGTWLPGDGRGWVEYRHGFKLPDPILKLECAARMSEDACRLAPDPRDCVNQQVLETCLHKDWLLHAVNCRSNHIHVVLSSPAQPRVIREQLKAWCTRRLNEQQAESGVPERQRRKNWWTERGSIRWIFNDADLAAAIDYVVNQQENPERFAGKPDA